MKRLLAAAVRRIGFIGRRNECSLCATAYRIDFAVVLTASERDLEDKLSGRAGAICAKSKIRFVDRSYCSIRLVWWPVRNSCSSAKKKAAKNAAL